MSADKKLAAIEPEPEAETSTPAAGPAVAAEVGSEKEKEEKEEKEAKEETEKKEEETEASTVEPVVAETAKSTSSEPAPPPMPTRPSKQLSQTDITISQLVDVFPHLDLKYIKMALIASEGRLEPASNALLFLSDPNSGIEIPQTPSAALSSSGAVAGAGSKGPTLEESDEALARRLARAYERGSRRTSASKTKARAQDGDISHNHIRRTPSMTEHHAYNNYIDDKDYDNEEDLYDTITKNVNDAKQVVGGWFGNVAKKIQESIDQPAQGSTAQRPPVPNRRQSPSSFNSPEPYSRSPYQQPQSIQRGYYSQKNEYVVNDDDDEDAPKLPARNKGPGHLYPAVGGGQSDIETPVQIKMTDDSSEQEDAPKPIEKDDLYTTNSAKITMNKKSEPTTATTTTNTKATPASSDSKTWTPLKSVDPEPSSDAFLVDDSEDDEEKD